MSSKAADRVKETSTTTGTGALTLAGAVSNFQSFSAGIGVGNTCWYAIIGQGGEWETGLGTLSAASTLTRDTVYDSSNAGALVNFSAGSKDVFVTLPASQIVDSPGVSVDGEVSLFSGTTGKELKRATGSGIPKLTSGVQSIATPNTDYIADEQNIINHPYSATEPNCYQGAPTSYSTLNFVMAANRLYAYIVRTPRNLASVIKDLDIYVVTGVAATNVRAGIYTLNASGFPDQLVANTDSGNLSSATSATPRTFTPGASVQLTPGRSYAYVFESDGAPTLRSSGQTPPSHGINLLAGDTTGAGVFYVAHTYGALPSTFPAGTRVWAATGGGYCVFVRWSS